MGVESDDPLHSAADVGTTPCNSELFRVPAESLLHVEPGAQPGTWPSSIKGAREFVCLHLQDMSAWGREVMPASSMQA